MKRDYAAELKQLEAEMAEFMKAHEQWRNTPLDLDNKLLPLLRKMDFDESETARLAEKIRSSLLPFLRLKPTACHDTNPWQSKCFGLPYLPKDQAYPCGEDGRPLMLLAQINFAETPPLPGYPDSGLLQFFISDGSLYGKQLEGDDGDDFDDQKYFNGLKNQANFRIVFYDSFTMDTDMLTTDFSFLPDFCEGNECGLAFQWLEDVVPPADYRFERFSGVNCFDDEDGIWEIYGEEISTDAGHKIGGYAAFSQEDPRYSAPSQENWLLLLQIDSDDEMDIMWGDGGVANFFIRDTDLQQRDFSQVIFHWDCP